MFLNIARIYGDLYLVLNYFYHFGKEELIYMH